MNLETKVKVRKYCPVLMVARPTEVTLGEVVRNPINYNMADLGTHLVNEIRRDLELPLIDPKSVAGTEDL